MHIELIVLGLTILANLFLGTLIMVRAYSHAYAWYFLGITTGVIIWSIGDIMILAGRSPALLDLGRILFYAGPMFIPMFLWFFSRSFPEERSLRPWHLAVGFLPVIAFVPPVIIYFQEMASIVVGPDLNEVSPNLSIFYYYGAYLGLFFVASYIMQFHKMRRLRGISYSQVAYTFYGIIFASSMALLTNVALPIAGVKGLIWLGPAFTVLGIASIALAIIRYRLFDIRAAILRSLAYLTSLILISILYVLLVNIVQHSIFDGQDTVAAQVFNIAAVLFIAYTFTPLTRLFNRLTAKFFYRDAYDPQTFIDQLNKVLVNDIELNKLLQEVSRIIATNLKAEYCLLGIKETKFQPIRVVGTAKKDFSVKDIKSVRHLTPHLTQIVTITDNLPSEQAHLKKLLQRYDIAMICRLAPEAEREQEGLGYLVLGPKKSGNPYGTQDTKIMSIIAKELVIAIQNILHFEEIENFNDTLQQKIDEATRKLRNSNEKLRQMDQTKDDFISMASHQLRTPLTSVKGYVSMVLDGDAGELTPLQRKLLNQSYISSQRMVYLISDLLNVSRLRTGKFIIEAIPSNLAKVINEEIEQLKETAKGRNLELTYDKPEHFPTLMLDETKVRQVIMNFIDNAIYYTPSGGHIRVALADKRESIEFTVSDDGIGVPKREQPHLFTKFFRAHNAQRARPDGTGLGLFMAKKIIVAQGGAIIFKSQEGKGSTFGFTFAKEKLLPQEPAPPVVPK